MPYYGPGTPWHDRKDTSRLRDDLEANIVSVDSVRNVTASSNAQSEPQYSRTGRGGAGNYGANADAIAVLDPADNELSKLNLQKVGGPNRTTGRGGAGNYEASANATDPQEPDDEALTRRIRVTKTEPSAKYGRGGLGNHTAAALENEEVGKAAEVEESRRRENLRVDIEKGVEKTLAMPGRAKLPLSSPNDPRLPG